MKSSKRHYRMGVLALVLSAFLWATAYVYVKHLVDCITPVFLLALRFSLASLLLLVPLLWRRRKITKIAVKNGIVMGSALFFEFYFFTEGVKHTTASKSSFIISAYIILLPLIYYAAAKKKPKKNEIAASFLCMGGLCFLFTSGIHGFNYGDLLCCFSAVAYGIHVAYSAKYVKGQDSFVLNFFQLASAAVLSTAATAVTGSFYIETKQFPVFEILYLAVICTVLPYLLSLYGMKYVSATTSGILLSLESVFATILAVLLLSEPMYWQLAAGGAMVLFSFAVSEGITLRKKKTSLHKDRRDAA